MQPIQLSSYFDILGQSQKIYSRLMEPVCRKWALTRNELDVVLFLYNNPGYDRAADIVSRRGMTKSHVSLSVASLAERGLLQRRFSETDRRTAHLVLTEQAQSIALEARQAQREFFSLLYAGIPEEELAVWNSVARKIRENIENLNNSQTNP